MPKDNMTSKPGSAPIIKQGHTTSGKYGSDPMPKSPVKNTTRDLGVK